jgi:hypothetical protein
MGRTDEDHHPTASSLIDMLMKRPPTTIPLPDAVTDDECTRLIARTYRFFHVLHEVVNNPFTHSLCVLAGLPSQFPIRERAQIVASLMLPHAQRIRAHDETLITDCRNGLMASFHRYAADVLESIWTQLTPANRVIMWAWLVRIVDDIDNLVNDGNDM